eukprot:TRINITY_DN184_c0_g1_i1.p1 TRINITY_DN184_c0_g1~~TRINITY_DN184_c0_g1_i1.p1  ORF type:complete len:186 (+),score=51.41 TRINITY_DN184_c0_g1_i1:22-558(+)
MLLRNIINRPNISSMTIKNNIYFQNMIQKYNNSNNGGGGSFEIPDHFENLLLSSREKITGKNISEELGIVVATSVRSRGFLLDTITKIKSLIGGELHNYSELLSDSCYKATSNLAKEAKGLGATGVVRIRFQISNTYHAFTGGLSHVIAYGTAVRFEGDPPLKIEDKQKINKKLVDEE